MPTIVISSPEAAELFLKTHDLVFASRPPHEGSKHISSGQKNLSFSEYGVYWRDTRKMCTIELLSNHKINSFKSMRREEVSLCVESIRAASNNRSVAVDLSDKVSSLSVDMSCRMVLGKKYRDEEFDERGFKAVVREGIQLASAPNLGDYIPIIAPLDLQVFTKRMKSVNKAFDNLFEKIIEEHLQPNDGERTKDFVDVMVGFIGSEESEYRIERPHVKAIILVSVYTKS
ncbi:cytochrome P450 CYP736A12 [Prunus yedoensis var. nudiflora]|uniref:Cytochrome P450 CYP736A12 n=1 Tax=Prunus yedoensis var. nudiflora TaxID=2094558 RepID=A0A314YBZ6_PRUYE|nr:cytochrome P450 CYP736A12 [Prunus yedoensis var. nudiflora]